VGKPAQRLGDSNTYPAAITNITNHKVKVNSLLVSVDGSSVASHLPVDGVNTHTSVKTANGSSTVFAGGTAVNREEDNDTCGHARDGGSSNVNIG
jgi:uncharacterized Zn-binding protein involved in type VI secretion